MRCGNGTEWPMNSKVIDRRVWYRRSITVRGSFKIYGSRGASLAARHCRAVRRKSPLLTVTLKMGQSATRSSLAIRLDDTLPWAG